MEALNTSLWEWSSIPYPSSGLSNLETKMYQMFCLSLDSLSIALPLSIRVVTLSKKATSFFRHGLPLLKTSWLSLIVSLFFMCLRIVSRRICSIVLVGLWWDCPVVVLERSQQQSTREGQSFGQLARCHKLSWLCCYRNTCWEQQDQSSWHPWAALIRTGTSVTQ